MEIAIIGAGFSGLGMAMQLKRAGLHDFQIFERTGDVGGVWRDNTYPGVACDVESHLYSFRRAPNPHWQRMYSEGAQIWQYLRDCVDQHQLQEHLRFNHDLLRADWDQEQRHWRLTTSQGSFTARILISGAGVFNEPLIPALPGLENFRGKTFHSAHWDHTHDLRGQRVAVIGTGASAIQFIPQLQPIVAQMTVFQRTPAWILPRLDRPVKRWEQKLLHRFPRLQKMRRWGIYWRREFYGLAFRRPSWMRFAQRLALRHMHRTIKDPAMRRQLTPNYTIGCKRVLLADDFYTTLVKTNVALVTDKIRRIHGDGIETATARHSFDTIIFGTGFKVTNFQIAHTIFGKNGRALFETWHASPRAFLGTTVSEFPNFFLLMGPNTGLGHSSVLLMMEAQIDYVLQAIQWLRQNPDIACAPKPERERQYTEAVDQLSARTVWKAGHCQSWYLDHTGRNSTLWPTSVHAFRRRLKTFVADDYVKDGL